MVLEENLLPHEVDVKGWDSERTEVLDQSQKPLDSPYQIHIAADRVEKTHP